MDCLPGSDRTYESFYDFYDPPEYRTEQLRFYRDAALQCGGPVLELGCGTGTIVLELATAGLSVVGLDICADALRIAELKLRRAGPEVSARVTLTVGDMKDFRLPGLFRTVLVPNNSFGYLTKPSERIDCLRLIREHLEPGGSFLVEERCYTPESLVQLSARRLVPTVQMVRVNPATALLTSFVWVTAHVDPLSQTITSRQYIEEIQADGLVRRFTPRGETTTRQHYFTRPELELLMQHAGFSVTDVWGDYRSGPVTISSYSMIACGRRA